MGLEVWTSAVCPTAMTRILTDEVDEVAAGKIAERLQEVMGNHWVRGVLVGCKSLHAISPEAASLLNELSSSHVRIALYELRSPLDSVLKLPNYHSEDEAKRALQC